MKIIYMIVCLSFFNSYSYANINDYKAAKPYDWAISASETQNMNPEILSKAFDEARNKSYYYSLLVVKNGFLVAEEYYNGHDKYNMDEIFSVTKSFISALIGIAIEKGNIDSVDQKIGDYYNEDISNDPDPRKKEITIKHLLTMQSGFEEESKFGFELYKAADMISYIISSNLRFNPGEQFLYSSHGAHILSGIIKKSTGKSTYDFAKKFLFRPIGIDAVLWYSDLKNNAYGGAGLNLTPRDMARFGYLFLKKGRLNDQQIVPAEWIEESTKNHRMSVAPWKEIEDVGYGYLWWTGRFGNIPVYFASGIGGQWILNIPELDMVIVATMNAKTATDWQQGESFITLVDKYILPAVNRQ